MIDFLQTWSLRQPGALSLAAFPWLVWGWRYWRGSRHAYAEPHLRPWAMSARGRDSLWKSAWRHLALALAWLLFAIALAGPRQPLPLDLPVADDAPALIVVLDMSRSMTARDVEPSRLQRARLELRDLVERSRGLRIGLVVFAGRPHRLLPPTADKAVLRHALSLLRHGMLPSAGSDAGAALAFAARQAEEEGARALLLVSDGDVRDEGLDATVTALRAAGLTLHVLGVGDRAGEALQGEDGQWLQSQGQAVVSRLQEQTLRRLARLGGGRYARADDGQAEWRLLYDRGIAPAMPDDTDDDAPQAWREGFAWPLGLGLLLLWLGHLRVPAGAPVSLLLAALLVNGMQVEPAQAAGLQAEAYAAYQQQRFEQSRRDYARVPGHAGRMGEGGSAYRLGDYAGAARQFTLAVLEADEDGQRADALFNLANSLYRLGRHAEAVEVYLDVLRYRPDDPAARRNLVLAERLRRRHVTREGEEGDGRPGRGPRSARVPDGSEVRGAVRLDNRDGERLDDSELPLELSGQDFRQAGPVVRRIERFEDRYWRYLFTGDADIARQARELDVDEAEVWQRLFEAEEGIPAPLARPRELPGLPPW